MGRLASAPRRIALKEPKLANEPRNEAKPPGAEVESSIGRSVGHLFSGFGEDDLCPVFASGDHREEF